MNKELDGLIGNKGDLTLFDTSLKSNQTKLNDERTKAVERINVRYEVMSNKFAAYDTMISNMNSGFKSLQMQIDAMVSNKG
jgi:flagellar hook-associated protein 2